MPTAIAIAIATAKANYNRGRIRIRRMMRLRRHPSTSASKELWLFTRGDGRWRFRHNQFSIRAPRMNTVACRNTQRRYAKRIGPNQLDPLGSAAMV